MTTTALVLDTLADAWQQVSLSELGNGEPCVVEPGGPVAVEKLRASEPLTPKERKVHQVARAVLHDELDRVVADAYGWPWPVETEDILARLVALHDERVEEERRGLVRWQRPEYQVPRFGDNVGATGEAPDPGDTEPDDLRPCPEDAIEQLTVLHEATGDESGTAEEILEASRVRPALRLKNTLETLELLGAVTRDGGGRWSTRARYAAELRE